MKARLRKISAIFAFAAIFASAVFISAVPATYANSAVANSAEAAYRSNSATLTGAAGNVTRMDYVDNARQVLGEPQPARVNDILKEGSLVATGASSWAEVCWTSVKTRAWSNTVVRVCPNARLVYLQGGEVLFRLDKGRKNRDDVYSVGTKLLQARIHGTTVTVTHRGNLSEIIVQEGLVEVLNKVDGSKVKLGPGVVYQVRAKLSGSVPGFDNGKNSGSKPGPAASNSSSSTPLSFGDWRPTALKAADSTGMIIFDNKLATTKVYRADLNKMRDHPLISACGEKLDSLPLIEQACTEVAALPVPYTAEECDKLFCRNLRIIAAPRKADYYIGMHIDKELPLPRGNFSDFRQIGVIGVKPKFKLKDTPAIATQVRPLMPALVGIPLLQDPSAQLDKVVELRSEDVSRHTEDGDNLAEQASTLYGPDDSTIAACVISAAPAALQLLSPIGSPSLGMFSCGKELFLSASSAVPAISGVASEASGVQNNWSQKSP